MKKITLFITLFSIVSSNTIRVPSDYSTIQEGIDASVDGDTVLVAQGTYYENLILNKEIVLASHAINDELGSDWLNNENITGTIVSGAEEPIDPNKGSCLIIRDGNIQPTIMGITFQDGDGTSMLVPNCEVLRIRSGGAILIFKAYPTINYNRFIDNGFGNDNVRAGRGGRQGGAMGHFAEDGVEFDEDRSFSSQNDNQDNNSTRDIPETLNIQNNYFENNSSGDGENFYSYGYEGDIDVSNSIFEDIDCETNKVNDFVLRSIEEEADFIQNDISGNCIESNSFYVSANGSDDSEGTLSEPLKTIGQALTLVKKGQTVTTINLASGTYSPTGTGEVFPIVLPDNVHLIGEGRETTILDAEADEENEAAVMIIKEVENVRVSGLTLTGGSSEGHGCTGGGGLLITTNDMWNLSAPVVYNNTVIENLIIRGNESHNGGGLSIFKSGGVAVNNVIIKNNEATDGGGGLVMISSRATITNTTLTGNNTLNAGNAAYIMHSDILMTRSIIVNNNSTTGWSAIVFDHSIVTLINCTIANNVSEEGAGVAVHAASGAGSGFQIHADVINSIIFYNYPEQVIIYDDEEDNISVTGAIYYSNIKGGWDGDGYGNINEPPNFVEDPYNADFTLQQNSPCIDAGTADFLLTQDIDYVGDAPDMGALEFGGITGCADPEAVNFDPGANINDGTCVFGPLVVVYYNDGWNMVSFPFEVEDASYETLFPNAQEGTLYSFGDTYEEQDELFAGNGYLLRMTSDDEVRLTGTAIYEVTNPLTAGWNLFSGTYNSHSVEELYANDIVYSGTVYGLDANYYNPEFIEPGRGYWIRATEAGEMTLGAQPSEFKMIIWLDNYPYETSWDLIGPEGLVANVSQYTNNYGVEDFSAMLMSGDYVWTIYDSYGDGLCCAGGTGSYELMLNEEVIATGGQFASMESVNFTVGARNHVNSLTTTRLPDDVDLPEEKGNTPLVGNIDFITETIEYDVEDEVSRAVSAKLASIIERLKEANSISFSTENYSSDLYFGVDVPEDEWLSYSLPPTFPQIAFDVRFSGDTKLVPESGEIEIITQSEMITIAYDIKVDAGERMSWILRSESGIDYTIEGTGEITVPSEERFVLNKEIVIPSAFTLHQNFPNPFNPITTLMYDLPSDAFVTLSIYDMLGREVTQLVNTNQKTGFKSVTWNATDSMGKPVSAGVYLYQIQAGEFVQTRKMVLLK